MAAEPGPELGPDPELEALLESALDDFERTRPPPPPPPGPGSGPEPSPSSTAKGSLFAAQERFFEELFEGDLAAQAAAEFDRAMQELAREEPHLVEQFQKLSEAAGRVGSDAASQREFTSCLKETLSGLAKNASDLQSSSASEEELAKALEGLGLEEGDGDGDGGVLPVMRSIMQSLLSKDVLYPSLKEITEKLEGERPGEGEDERRQRFESLLGLMQQLQDLGHPPKELAGETPPGFNMELPGGEQCSLM
ncbi:peroxisomal biogenesis factor 19 isoform 2-T2 [Amazona ochrocephala]